MGVLALVKYRLQVNEMQFPNCSTVVQLRTQWSSTGTVARCTGIPELQNPNDSKYKFYLFPLFSVQQAATNGITKVQRVRRIRIGCSRTSRKLTDSKIQDAVWEARFKKRRCQSRASSGCRTARFSQLKKCARMGQVRFDLWIGVLAELNTTGS